MSFALFEQETANRLDGLKPTKVVEPGVFDNFLYGTGMGIMREGFATLGRGLSLVGSVGAVLQDTDKYGQRTSTEAQDKYFKRHDDLFNRAVDHWTPKPREVGVAGQVVGQLIGTLPLLIASPAALVAKTQLSTGEDLVRKGVDTGSAQAVGAIQGAGMGVGIWLPILGRTLAQRALVGGAGGNVVQGVATRGASEAILKGTPGADEFKAFDPTALTLDVLLGLTFGGLAHLSPAQRAQGEAAWKRIQEWTGTLKPSDIDALATLRQAEHLNVDAQPGRPERPTDVNAHTEAMRQAVDDLLNDRPVNIDALMEGARFLPDGERASFGKRMTDELNSQARRLVEAAVVEQAARIRAAELPGFIRSATELVALREAAETQTLHPELERAIQIARKPGALRTAEEKLMLDSVMQGRAQDFIELPPAHAKAEGGGEGGQPRTEQGAEADPVRTEAERFADERPDLVLTVGRNSDGSPIQQPIGRYLEDARMDAELAAGDVRLFEIAAGCMLGGR